MNDRILVVDDEAGSREGLRRLLEAWGYEAETAGSGEEALDRIEDGRATAVITDLVMPGLSGLDLIRRLKADYPLPIIVLSGQGTIEQAVEAIKLGANDFLEKPVEPAKLKILLEKMDGARELLAENRRLRAELREKGSFGPLRGISEKMKQVFRQIEQVAPSTLSVLVTGESGTGKELVAQTLHELSPRRRNEFVALNCAAIPATLLESEIFGHERGAFTGALQRKIGCFEMANLGTLFLDEIAEMDENLQAKLLRVLQSKHFRRVGGTEVVESDVRVIAATNREPKKAIEEGRLREDLYYRLNVFAIELPPLRDRPEDIPLLARHFAEQAAVHGGAPIPPFDQSAMDAMMMHSWPGNVRELKNAIERATLLSGGSAIMPEHLPPEVAMAGLEQRTIAAAQPRANGNGNGAVDEQAIRVSIGSTIQDAEEGLIRSTLAHTGGNKTRAAKILGISVKTMHNKIKKYGL
ncbi:hypothetical protein ABI59_01960 [Acidobacteria bacterium Mor1]|nr:hypothetical protein ABI59_01960 [Acidobacteria bacterium Mor1]